MLYCLKLYPDIMSKEGLKIIELEADDAECEEFGETIYLNFLKGTGKEVTTVYGVDFSKVIEFYRIDSIINIEETGKTSKSLAPRLTVIDFKKSNNEG